MKVEVERGGWGGHIPLNQCAAKAVPNVTPEEMQALITELWEENQRLGEEVDRWHKECQKYVDKYRDALPQAPEGEV